MWLDCQVFLPGQTTNFLGPQTLLGRPGGTNPYLPLPRFQDSWVGFRSFRHTCIQLMVHAGLFPAYQPLLQKLVCFFGYDAETMRFLSTLRHVWLESRSSQNTGGTALFHCFKGFNSPKATSKHIHKPIFLRIELSKAQEAKISTKKKHSFRATRKKPEWSRALSSELRPGQRPSGGGCGCLALLWRTGFEPVADFPREKPPKKTPPGWLRGTIHGGSVWIPSLLNQPKGIWRRVP